MKICPELSHHYTLVHTGGVHEQIGINGLDNIGGKQEDILFLKLKSRKGLSLSSRGCLVTYQEDIIYNIYCYRYLQTRKYNKDYP